MQALKEIFELMETDKEQMEFLPTGFSDIDTFLDGGFLRKELIVLGGSTGIGKSYLAGQIFLNIAQKGFKTAYFSLEMSNQMIVSRMMGALANIKPILLFAGFLTPEQYEKKLDAKAQLSTFESFMSFYDNIYDLDEIKKEVRSNKYEFIVIDFIQNIFVQNMDEYTRLSFTALELQKLAKETNCCILVLSQLSNSVIRESDKKTIIEYKGSGNIATVCDLGFFIERADGWEDNENVLRINIRKNRRGNSHVYFDHVYKQPGGLII